MGRQRRGNRLPALRPALLAQQDQALPGIGVFRGKRVRAATPAGPLGVQPDDHRAAGLAALRVGAARRSYYPTTNVTVAGADTSPPLTAWNVSESVPA